MDKPLLSFSLLLILLFLLPQFIFPLAEDSYLIPKFTLLYFGIILILFLSIRNLKHQILNVHLSLIAYCLVVFLVLNIISLSYASSIQLAAKEIQKWVFLVLLYFIFIWLIRTEKQLEKIGYSLLVSGLVTAIWTILQDYRIPLFRVLPRLPDWRGYLVAGLGNSDYVAGFLVSIFPLGFVYYAGVTETKRKVFLFISLSLIYAALIITFSVGANAGLILGMTLVLGYMFYHRKQQGWFQDIRRWLWLILIFAGITAFYSLPIPFNGRGESIFTQAFKSARWKEGGNTRFVIWSNTWELIKAQPFFGTGAGNFTYRYLDYIAPQILTNPRMKPYSGEYTNAAHNEILHTWAELGLPGVIILLLLITSFYFSVWRILFKQTEMLSRNPKTNESLNTNDCLLSASLLGGIGGFTALLIYGLMSYPLHLPTTAMVFIFYLAIPEIILNLSNQSPILDSSTSKPRPQFESISFSLSTSFYLLSSILFILLSFWAVRPFIADIYFRIGKDALKIQNEPQAVAAFIAATKWDNHADAHYHLGELYLRGRDYGGQITLAITEFESARKQRNDKYLLYELGVAYQLAERYQDALTCFKPLTERQPDNPEYWERLSYVYLKLGKLDLSHEAHLKATELKNND
ncbi:MAG: O-antigen ligase family protein [bacterium]|nr:O-antigen ligase family protein [bacterium]